MQTDRNRQAAKIYPLTLKPSIKKTRTRKIKFKHLNVALFVFLSAVFLFVLGLIVSRAVGPLYENGKPDQTVTRRIRETGMALDEIRQTLLLLNQDSNELRQAVGLPQRFYSSLNPFEGEEGDVRQNDLAFFRAIDLLNSKRYLKEHSAEYQAIRSSIREVVSIYGLEIKDTEYFSMTISKGGDTFFRVIYIPEEGKILIKSFLDAHHESSKIGDEIKWFLKENIEGLSRHFRSAQLELAKIDTLRKKSAVRNLLKQNGLSVAGPIETDEQYLFTITRGNESLADFGLRKKTNTLLLNARVVANYDEFEKQLIDLIGKLDTSDYIQTKMIEVQNNMNHVFSATAFVEVMNAKGMRASEKTRESKEYVHYDVLDDRDRRIGSFAIQKGSGDIFMLDSDDLPICTLQSLLNEPEDQKKN